MKTYSRIFQGSLRHRRFVPTSHQLDYAIFMLYMDLDELPRLFQGSRWWSWNRKNIAAVHDQDYADVLNRPNVQRFDQNVSLKARVISLVRQEFPVDNDCRVMMLTHGRYFGHCFNPVTFYYVYDRNDQLLAIVSDITNTPWNERHAYVHIPGVATGAMRHTLNAGGSHCFEFDKAFHVSPFNPMDMFYQWHFSEPSENLNIQMNVSLGSNKHFDATLRMEALEWSGANLNATLRAFPLMTVKVVWGIYWHALRLWLKRAPFYDNPSSSESERSGKRSIS